MENKAADGVMMGRDRWVALNTTEPFGINIQMGRIAPFPPMELMRNVSGLTVEADFAAHGAVIYTALERASPVDITKYQSVLDFGCGCGRLARYLKGHPGIIAGCDLDPSHVQWINNNLPYMQAELTKPNKSLPFQAAQFDCVISISVFTHMDEHSQFFYLSELVRCTAPGAYLFLTVHGARAMTRAQHEKMIFDMLEIPQTELEAASNKMQKAQHAFILQNGHLTSSEYAYGITFLSADYIHKAWSAYFEIEAIISGAIHDFQDIVVCRRV